MIQTFIDKEISYFQPIIEHQAYATDRLRNIWRKETVAQRLERISLETYDIYDGYVQRGMFKGLKLNRDTWWGKSDLGAQCLGLYEREILNFIESRGQGYYKSFVDIGAADGYYAVGMLFSGTVDNVACFEISEEGRSAIQRNWEKNGKVGKLKIFGKADPHSLKELPAEYYDRALVIIDIEGNEFDLLTEDTIKLLENCDVIIEVHNWVDGFISRYIKLLKKFSKYFFVEALEPLPRDLTNFEELRHYSDDNRLLLASERRPCLMRFLKLTPLG